MPSFGAGLVGLILASAASATAATTPAVGAGSALVEIAPGVHLLPGRFVPGTQPDGSTVILRGPEGLIVVDTGRHAGHTQAIVDFAKAAGVPVKAIVNTHWHLDHIGGNPRLRREFPGVKVIASGALAEARTGFLAKYRDYLEQTLAKAAADPAAKPEAQDPLRAELAILDAGPELEPHEVITASGPKVFAGRSLVLELETRAVTAGDVWIFDPASKVLIAGDLVTLPAPFLDTACPQRWQAALEHLARTPFEILVPGHGAAMTRKDFERYQPAFSNLLACAASARAKEECVSGWLRDAGVLVPAADHAFTRSLVEYYLDQHLRGDPAATAKLCG